MIMKLKYILGFIIIIGLSIIYYKFNPEVYNFFPECPFHKYLHLDCPGCGSQRAVHALLHGHVLSAANYNLLMVLSIPLLLVHFSLKVYSQITKKDFALKIWYHPSTPKIIFAIVILFWITRNIPFVPFNYLAS
ncbi:DUF2752 domain-containing protein [Pedobacter paludis]|uniref:DUF2752 domain-containing protein n=1 Tax=Pedobacter paludis TaxID=2203212 RepID=A0A317F2H5_9SPHI|nr:DUF2752 domain-containing protein [Pedobacter paludis]